MKKSGKFVEMEEEKFIRFLLDHDTDDPNRLLLSAARWPGIDVRRAARCIEARRKIRDKVPAWHAHPELDYPGSLALEQCSSEATARYKQAFVPEGARMADLTGGLGVDCWFLSQRAAETHYCERNAELCAAARHNFSALGSRPIAVHEGDGIAWLRAQEGRFDLLYLDPARRGKSGEKVYDMTDCEPNLLEIKELLLDRADRVLTKISPMADITRTLRQIPETRELHVVETGGEVRELLLLLASGPQAARIHVYADGRTFNFSPEEEAAAEVRYATHIGRYLFQPAKALRKAGAFRLLSKRFGLTKLAPSTHLYTADEPAEGFPGKCFEVEEVLEWNRAVLKTLRSRYDRLELSALNFPMDTDALRSRLGIADGGAHHAFATVMDNKKLMIICKI